MEYIVNGTLDYIVISSGTSWCKASAGVFTMSSSFAGKGFPRINIILFIFQYFTFQYYIITESHYRINNYLGYIIKLSCCSFIITNLSKVVARHLS